MSDLLVAIGLVLVLEGAMYALFPNQMIEMLRKLPDIPPAILRAIGLVGVAVGWVIVWLVRN